MRTYKEIVKNYILIYTKNIINMFTNRFFISIKE